MVSRVDFIYVLAVENHCLTFFSMFLLKQLFVTKTTVVQKRKEKIPLFCKLPFLPTCFCCFHLFPLFFLTQEFYYWAHTELLIVKDYIF